MRSNIRSNLRIEYGKKAYSYSFEYFEGIFDEYEYIRRIVGFSEAYIKCCRNSGNSGDDRCVLRVKREGAPRHASILAFENHFLSQQHTIINKTIRNIVAAAFLQWQIDISGDLRFTACLFRLVLSRVGSPDHIRKITNRISKIFDEYNIEDYSIQFDSFGAVPPGLEA